MSAKDGNDQLSRGTSLFGGEEVRTPLPKHDPGHVVDGWDDVEQMLFAKDDATKEERSRCETIVLGELECGRLRGIPETAGVMVILHRIALAISSG